jgi:HAE1 family hydrophobic/amphiphilic exporter-1
MVSGVLLGLFVIPVLFVIFQSLQERITGIPLAVLNDEERHLKGLTEPPVQHVQEALTV